MNIRRIAFFLTDRDKMVKNHLEEIEKANAEDPYADELHNKCISNLLEYVKQYVPYYKKLQINNFEDLPVVNKVLMKNDINEFRTTKKITLGKVRHTSGSTGIPFEIYQDREKAKRIQAEVVYYRELTGDELGTKFINLISPSRLESSSRLSEIKQNVVNFDVTTMDNNTIEKLHQLLIKDHSIKYMMGYASALQKIASYFEEKNYKPEYSLKAVVSSSEILTDSMMEKMRTVLGCNVYDRYSNEDNGFIAQTNGKSHEFIVNRASYYVEILKLDSDQPADEDEIGRIVVTDYYNYAQPFLRYDTGDLGAYSYKKVDGANRYVITKLAGRRSDVVYDINDKPISTFAIGCALEVFNKIKQYQLIQLSKTELVLNLIDPMRQYADEEYEVALQNVLGSGLELTINYLDVIPVLDSGKFQRVICKYKPEK